MTVAPGGPEALLLILLVAGHLLGDFAFQSERMAHGKGDGRYLVGHIGLILGAHLLLLAPLLTWSLVGVVVGVAVLHGLIDLVKARGAFGTGLRSFLIDQAAHIVTLLVAWVTVVYAIGAPEVRWSDPALGWFVTAAMILGVFAFNATGGAALVRGVLTMRESGLEEDEGLAGSGRLIGILERTLSLVLILVGQWAALAILIGAKSIARFDELKDRRFSEYYLIGTLTSLLVAVLNGLFLIAALSWR
jgi:hypothetical protein